MRSYPSESSPIPHQDTMDSKPGMHCCVLFLTMVILGMAISWPTFGIRAFHRLESEHKKKKTFFVCFSERFLSSFDIFYPMKVEYYCIFGIYSSKRENWWVHVAGGGRTRRHAQERRRRVTHTRATFPTGASLSGNRLLTSSTNPDFDPVRPGF